MVEIKKKLSKKYFLIKRFNIYKYFKKKLKGNDAATANQSSSCSKRTKSTCIIPRYTHYLVQLHYLTPYNVVSMFVHARSRRDELSYKEN